MASCIFFSSGICWKSETQLAQTSGGSVQVLWTSGNCNPCLNAMLIGTYNMNRVRMLGDNMILASSSRIQYTGMV